ncbi:MAG: hypothetical protein V2I36_10845 [Desulfopila sp.]|jgi:hypothetical protein|nr:hypothetical protein [Desulfopila sp.]
MMKTRLLLSICFFFILLTGCALPPTLQYDGREREIILQGKPLNIRIDRWGATQFTGLIGMRQREENLHYALLDATGVKLLEAEVNPEGGYEPVRSAGPLKNSALAPFLSQALARIYLQEPATQPCSGSWWYRLCRHEKLEGGWIQYGKNGPFTLWKAEILQGIDEKNMAILYHQPWLGIQILLGQPSAVKE